METFRIGEAISYGWEKFKKHFLFLWMILATTWLISIGFNLLQKGAGDETLLGGLISVVAIVVSLIVNLGLIRMYLDLADGTESKLERLFSQYRFFWKYLGGVIVYSLMVVLGLVLLIVPGIYLALRYQFFSYLIIDKNLGPIEALKGSAVMTDGVKWKLFGLSLTLLGLNLLGVVALVVGLLVTVPMSIMAYVYVYRALRDRTAVVPQGTPVMAQAVVTPPSTATVTPQPAVLVTPDTPENSEEKRQ